ncbi:hypothetical protein WJX73_006417 [Symbiochloris irregularis]|uniref:Prohibitin n=1 Tax=Symbiochloris irregularis TaxID=706552 RepID=A0AAW1NQS4_9CHLO
MLEVDRSAFAEKEALADAQRALGAQSVQKAFGASASSQQVANAARKLCHHASAITASVNLSGAILYIADRYEVSHPGTIYIPHNFE